LGPKEKGVSVGVPRKHLEQRRSNSTYKKRQNRKREMNAQLGGGEKNLLAARKLEACKTTKDIKE